MAKEREKTEKHRELDMRGFWVRLWRLVTPSHSLIKKVLILIMFGELVRLGGPYLLKFIIDEIASFSPEKLFKIGALIFAMFLVNQFYSLLDWRADKRIFNILNDIESYLPSQAHRQMMFLDLGYHERENTGSKITKIQRGVDRISNLFNNFFWEVAPTIFQIFFTAIVLFVVDWRFGAVVLVFVPLFVWLTLNTNKAVFPLRIERHDKQEEAAGVMAQSIFNINTVKSFVQENRECLRFDKIREALKGVANLEFAKILAANLKKNLINDLGRAMILFFGAYLVWQGGMTLGSLVFVYTISEKALISLFRISRMYDRIMESSEAVDRLFYLGQERPELINIKNAVRPKAIEGKIELSSVSFSYRGASAKALHGINLKIRPGCVTALVGPSGGGKTTLARMIYRHYDPGAGEILLDDVNLKKYDLFALRRFFAIVQQDVEIFDTSARENIAYAKPNAPLREIRAAAKIANADEFIKTLADGYETLLGERGVKLSGGQKQRIGIARAILANPKILIFDEATSNLDSESERLIQEAMERVAKNRTVIIIAHRLSTIRKADKIAVLEKGRVVEEGSHFELAKIDGGLYQKLLKLQAVGDID